MGNPTLGTLTISDSLTIQRCSPSFVWSECSQYLAVAQYFPIVKLFFANRVLAIDFEEQVVWSSSSFRAWLQPESFRGGKLSVTLNPSQRARELSWQFPDSPASFRAIPFASIA